MFLIILLYALFGSSFPISKTLLGFVGPIFLTGIRMFIAGSLLLIYQYCYAHDHFKFRWKNAIWYAQVVLFGIYLTYILRFWGLASLTSAKTAFLFNMMPFFSAFYSYFTFKERLTRQQWIGLAIGFLGFIPILISTSGPEKRLGELFFISWPELAVLAAVACQSYSWIIMRYLIKEKQYAPTMINGMTMFSGGILALITAYFAEPISRVADPGAFLSWLLLVILISNIICHNLYAHLLRKYTATFLAFAGFLGPLFSALYGWFFRAEKITWHFYLSAVIVFIGLYLFYRHELKHGIETPNTPVETPNN
jgi:drug/metabolite transporter (DMT)-like permease